MTGPRENCLVALVVSDGAINGEAFLPCVEQGLVSTLTEGDIVVMHNLSAHKTLAV